MGTTWVLHTETKGTGAQMVPLEKVQKRPLSAEPVFVLRERSRSVEARSPEPAAPRRFRIVNVMTRQHVLDDAGIRDALAVLRDARSVVDVNVYVWEEDRRRWRLLAFEEQHTLMELAGEQTASARRRDPDDAPPHRSGEDRPQRGGHPHTAG